MVFLTIAITIWVITSNLMISHLAQRVKLLEVERDLQKYVEEIQRENNPND